MEAVPILLAIFSVPLAAILSSTYLKAKRLNAERADSEVRRKVRELEGLTADLRERVENLETIATADPFSGLGPADSAGSRARLTAADPDAVDEEAARVAEEPVGRGSA